MAEFIHPAVRLSILLITATAISLGNYLVLATAFLAVAFCYWCCVDSEFRQGLIMLKRMRWFFLSITIVYLWFTPGEPLFHLTYTPLSLVPTFEGMELGLHRIFILILIIFMVNLLLKTTPQPRLLAAIYWWLRPMKYIGMNPPRAALRISLVLDFVQQGHELIGEARQSVMAKGEGRANKARLLGVAVGEVIYRVEQKADQQPLTLIDLPEVDNPAPVQWLLPVGVLCICLSL